MYKAFRSITEIRCRRGTFTAVLTKLFVLSAMFVTLSSAAFAKPPSGAPSTAAVTETAHGVDVPGDVYREEWAVFGIALFFAALALIAGVSGQLLSDARDPSGAERSGDPKDSGIVGWPASRALTVIGLLGALGHSVFVSVTDRESWAPNFDVTTIFWLGVALVGMILPQVSELSLGGVSAKKERRIKSETKGIIRDQASFAKWCATATNTLLAELEKPTATLARTKSSITNFLEEASREALEWVGRSGERRRLSIWLYDKDADALFFLFSNQVTDPETRGFSIRRGDGIIGTTFQDHKEFNKPNARELPIYVKIPGTSTSYRSVLCVPLDYGDERLGVVFVDRNRDVIFDRNAADAVRAAAAMFGVVLANERAKSLV